MGMRSTKRGSAALLAYVAGALMAGSAGPTEAATAGGCDLAAERPWIERWFAAWDLTSREILHLPIAPAPGLVFFDTTCVYTTLEVAAPGAAPDKGPAFQGTTLPWRTAAHGDTLTLPNARRVEVGLMSFADNQRGVGPFFVMSAPSIWEKRVPPDPYGYTPVFLHEFTHTRQMPGVAHILGPIDSTWKFEKELDDDAVQTRFGSDSLYVAAYLAERDLFYRAADAKSQDEARALAAEALAMMRRRHATWFRGDDAVFATLDDTFLSLEGAAQWAAAAWLAHPKGGGMTREAVVARMLGKGRWWSQDESLAIFLVVDRLVPGWQALVFRTPSAGVIELLERATR